MKQFLNQNGELDHKALWQALQDLEAGHMDSVDRDDLMEWVKQSPEAAEAYLEYFELSAIVADEAQIHCEQSSLPELACEVDAKGAAGRGRLNKVIVLFTMAAAAVVLIGVFGPKLFSGDGTKASGKTFLAEAVPGTLWEVNGEGAAVGKELVKIEEGSTVEVTSGTLKLLHETGAELVIQGPALVEFPQFQHPVLRHGWLWLDTKESDLEFRIDTPELLLEDIGTQFGTHVPLDGPAEVHLIEGRVDAMSKSSKQRILSLMPEEQGVAIPDGAEPMGVRLARGPYGWLEGLLNGQPDYRTVVMGQSPDGYWPLDETGSELVTDVMTGENVGRIHQGVQSGDPGPSSREGFAGFPDDHGSMRLDGIKDWAPLSLGASPVHSDLLFNEEFASQGTLHKARPATSMEGVRWVAPRAFRGDGALKPRLTGTATLPFVPTDDMVYTLDASFEDIRSDPGVDSWVGLGFSSGQSVSSSIHGTKENRFLEGTTTGRAWLLFRATGVGLPNQACLGTTGKAGGIADAPRWENWESENGGDADLRVVLDTTRGAGRWMATWFAKRPDSANYIQVRPATRLLNEEIRSLGLAVGKPGLSGSITSFSLRANPLATAPPQHDWLAETPATLSRRAGAVSVWIKSSADRSSDQIIWAAGRSPRDTAMHVRLSPEGQVGFFIENDRYNVLVTSGARIADGQWHHVVANWSPKAVGLFLDGKLVAEDQEFQPLTDDDLRDFYLGSGALGSRYKPLTATVDEVAIWGRPLSHSEIRQQWEASHRFAADR